MDDSTVSPALEMNVERFGGDVLVTVMIFESELEANVVVSTCVYWCDIDAVSGSVERLSVVVKYAVSRNNGRSLG